MYGSRISYPYPYLRRAVKIPEFLLHDADMGKGMRSCFHTFE